MYENKTETTTPTTSTPSWKSKTVIGSVVAVVCGILSFCGVDISADAQSVITDNLAAIGAAIGSLFGIYTAIKGSK